MARKVKATTAELRVQGEYEQEELRYGEESVTPPIETMEVPSERLHD